MGIVKWLIKKSASILKTVIIVEVMEKLLLDLLADATFLD